jgi:large subunit ribosomal protein L32
MGAVPKRKISKGRKNRRRAHNSLENPAINTCPKCGHPKRPHFECQYCGYYAKNSKTTKSKTSKSKK